MFPKALIDSSYPLPDYFGKSECTAKLPNVKKGLGRTRLFRPGKDVSIPQQYRKQRFTALAPIKYSALSIRLSLRGPERHPA